MNSEILYKIDSFVTDTLDIMLLRHIDSIIIIKPDKVRQFDSRDFEMLHALYVNKVGAEKTVEMIHERSGIKKDIIVRDLAEIIKSLNALMCDENRDSSHIKENRYNSGSSKHPASSEIALTYRCQNRCVFCCTTNRYRGNDFIEMDTLQAKQVINKLCDDAEIPAISFTGGEPSLRKDLPELIEYAVKKGMRTNLVTNGIKCSDREYVDMLLNSGLHSARVSLESHDEILHNRITGNMESFKKTVAGIHNLIEAGILTHTNTTICRKNRDHLVQLVRFVKDEFNLSFLSMDMVISTGAAMPNGGDIVYSSISSILDPVLRCCNENKMKLIWSSPVPYCMFNPHDHQIDHAACSCITGLLSIDPAGEVTTCCGCKRGIGSILKDSFDHIWNCDEAKYFREKKYTPPVCKKCDKRNYCAGGCPLYWEAAGSFREIEKINRRRPFLGNLLWSIENRLRSRAKIKYTDNPRVID